MTLIRTGARDKLTLDNRPDHCPASAAGRFVIRADGTARFDCHHHEFAEFWFIARGRGTILIGGTEHQVETGDILYTAPGQDHDILDVAEEMHVFYLSAELPPGASPTHLHRTPEAALKHPVPVRDRQQEADHA
jgi:mannose-6-phosphate isomerase-like protein (cupin superfamily)